MKDKILKLLPAALAVVLLLFVETVFMLKLKDTALLPVKYMILIAGVLLLLTVLCGFLMIDIKKLWCLIPGFLLMLLVIALLLLASGYIQRGMDTLLGVIKPEAATSAVDVLVRQDDPAQDISDAKDYTFGMLEILDRSNSQKAAEEISNQVGKQIKLRTYSNVDALVDALLKGKEVDAILLNDGFLLLLEEMEAEQEVTEKERLEKITRILHVVHVKEDVVENPTPPVTTAPPEDKLPVFTVYISGSDSRYGLNYRSNSDVNIIVVVNPNTKQVLLLSTPRDYYIPLSISNGVKDKLTHAGIYGVDVSMDTLSMLYDTSIEYYIKVNFTGFESIVDALGGITVYSEKAFTTDEGIHFVKGNNFVDGKQALAFARERKSFLLGDRQRGKNQMKLIEGIANKLLSPAILTNFSEVMASLEKCFNTNIPYDLISTLVRDQLDNGGNWELISSSVDGYDDYQSTYSYSGVTYVMIPDEEKVNHAKALIAAIKKGERLTQE